MAAAVACLVLAVIVGVSIWRAAPTRHRSPPTIARVAALALRDPTSAAPRADPDDPSFLSRRFAGVRFPNYHARFDAGAWGQRTDMAGGRTIQTVYYRLPDDRAISYSVVAGRPLSIPPAASRVIVAGVPIRSYSERGLSYVMLVRDGRTCVLAGRVSGATILALAAAPLLGA